MCPASMAHASERRRKLALVFGFVAASAACELSAALLRQSSAVIIATISAVYRLVKKPLDLRVLRHSLQGVAIIDALAFERKVEQLHGGRDASYGESLKSGNPY